MCRIQKITLAFRDIRSFWILSWRVCSGSKYRQSTHFVAK